MRINSRLAVFFLILTACVPLVTAAQEKQAPTPDLQWLELPNAKFEVNGLPWYVENKAELIRLPLARKESYRKEVWELAEDPSGGRIRFRTDSNTLAIKLEYPRPPGMRNMHLFGQSGVDVYVDGIYRGTAIPDRDAKPGKVYEHSYFNLAGKARSEREILIYLPLYMPVKVLGIGLDKDAQIRPATPFALKAPVVFYGTSITQGGCASRPGMSYQAILGRMLNVDFVNLGFSGNGIGEPELAQTVADIEASCYVLDFAQNNPDVASLRQAYDPFIETIRRKHPNTPILCNTPIWGVRDSWDPQGGKYPPMRELIRDVVAKRIAAGDRNIQLIEGTDFVGPAQADGFVDGSHPNDLGFHWMAEGFAARLSRMLGLKISR